MWNSCLSCCQETVEEVGVVPKRCVRPFTISPISTVKLSAECRLYRDQTLAKTALQGLEITIKRIPINNLGLYIQNELSPDVVMRGIVDTGNTETNKVTQNFYITSFGGLKTKMLKANKINLMLNATIDLPIVELPNNKNIEKLRVPITNKEPETLNLYLDDVADKIHENYLKNGNTLLYCHDGTLNSVALAIGYLIKYTDLLLSESLLHMQFTRKGFENADNNLANFRKPIFNFARKFGKNDICDDNTGGESSTKEVITPEVAAGSVDPTVKSGKNNKSSSKSKSKKPATNHKTNVEEQIETDFNKN